MNLESDAAKRHKPINEVCHPLIDLIPLDQAMSKLVGSDPKHTDLVEVILGRPELQNRPDLEAGLWLYVDDLDRCHRVAQAMEDTTGAFWHGIMHRREGDFSNSHYWMRRAANHPLLLLEPHLDPHALVDAAAAAQNGHDPNLVERQRAEWKALFEWCASREL